MAGEAWAPTAQEGTTGRISAVLHVLSHIPDALLHPHLVLIQLAFPLLQLLDLFLQLNQLVGDFPGITARPYTPEQGQGKLRGALNS